MIVETSSTSPLEVEKLIYLNEGVVWTVTDPSAMLALNMLAHQDHWHTKTLRYVIDDSINLGHCPENYGWRRV